MCISKYGRKHLILSYFILSVKYITHRQNIKIIVRYLESLNNEINAINTKLLDSLKGKKDVICTEEFVKICFSSNILENIELLNKLSGNPLFKI